MMKLFNLKRLFRVTLLPVAAAAVAMASQAQGSAASSPATGTTTAAKATVSTPSRDQYRGMRAGQVIGKEVRNPAGVNIGQIRDMIVNMNTGQIRYALLEFDPGILQGERLFAVPTNLLQLGSDDQLVYNMTREKLEKAGVPRADWDRTWGDPDYLSRMDKAWGVIPPSESARSYRVSDLLGMDVNSRSGEEIGEIEELVIDMAAQKVHYAVLEFDPSWMSPEKNFVFPLSAFKLNADRDELVLDVDKSKVRAMKSFDDSRYSSLNDRTWLVDVDRYLVTIVPTSDPQTAAGQAAGNPQHSSASSDLFKMLDRDRSGSIDRSEVRDSANIDREWTRLDKNKDGRISSQELGSGYSPDAKR